MRSKLRALTTLLAAVLGLTTLSVPALAFTGEDSETETTEPATSPLPRRAT